MKKEKEDRRIKYTKSLLKEALIRQMHTQHIRMISVKSLCDLADVNRSTFYAHYTDPSDLLHQIEEELLGNLKAYLESQNRPDEQAMSLQVLEWILEYLKENAPLCKVLLSENCDLAFQKDVMDLAQVIFVQMNSSMDQRTQEYLSLYSVTGCIRVIQKWLHDDMFESPAQISALIMHMTLDGIRGFQA